MCSVVFLERRRVKIQLHCRRAFRLNGRPVCTVCALGRVGLISSKLYVALGNIHMGTGSRSVDDVAVGDVWEQLKADPSAVLIDVRTRAEWTFVGIPDLSGLGKRVVTVEWQTFPDNSVDPDFGQRTNAALAGTSVNKTTQLFFICRSGARSRMAAEAIAELGFERCFNVADGFEGPLDANRHRGTLGGWKAAGMPWAQG